MIDIEKDKKRKTLLIDATGLLFIRDTTDIDHRISSIFRDSGITEYRIFSKRVINDPKKPYNNNREKVIKHIEKNYDLEIYDDMKSEMIKIWESDKERYVISTLSGELFDRLEGIHFDHYHKRNHYRKC